MAEPDKTSRSAPVQVLEGPIETMALNSDRKEVVLAGEGPGAALWSIGNAHDRELLQKEITGIDAVALDSDGSRIAVAGRDRSSFRTAM